MIGNNFLIQNSLDYNPLFDQPFSVNIGEKEKQLKIIKEPDECPVKHLFEELAEMNICPEDYCAHLLTRFPAYSFYIMANHHQCKVKTSEEDQLILPSDLGELEVEAIDILSNPEKVAKAVEEQAFVALKQLEGEEKIELKVAPKWERRIKLKKIRHLKIRELQLHEQEKKETCKIIKGEISITTFTAEEIDEISTILFKAVDIAYKIRNFEQQKKENEERKKNGQKEISAGEKQLKETLINRQFKKRNDSVAQKKSAMLTSASISKASQDEFIEKQRFIARREAAKQQAQLEQKDEKQTRMIKKEIQDFELKKETIKREIQLREIKQTSL